MNKVPKISEFPVVILAGGFGTRMREQTEFIPKPMVTIGNRPILWHIMKIYAHYGFRRFIICLGYKGDIIKEFFYHYRIHNCDFTVKLGSHEDIRIHNTHDEEDWEVTLVHTGLTAMTGARIKRAQPYLSGIDTFLLTYGDGVADINLGELLEFHFKHRKIATITGVRPPARFGELVVKNHRVSRFSEKPQISSGFINGGFFVFSKKVFKYLSGADTCTLEKEVLENLTRDRELMMYEHRGFWQCMDTLRNMDLLNQYWREGRALWKIWKDA